MLPRPHNPSVLTIDDDDDMRRSILSYLEDVGFTVHQACGGRQGIEMFRLQRQDLVLTDLAMPEVDGLAVVQEIARLSPETPVVVISGNGSVSHAIEAMRKGAWDYITKPILDFSALGRITRQVLERAQTMKSERARQEGLRKAVASQERRLSRIGSSDPLTGLPLRAQVFEAFSTCVTGPGFSGDLFVMLIEVDSVRLINESFGHDQGDRFLVDLARRFGKLIREDFTIGRIGTDQFVVLVANDPDLKRCIEGTLAVLERPALVQGQEVPITSSTGVAIFPQDGESINTLVQHADMARARAKTAGKNCHCLYTRELGDQMHSRIAMESGLRRGLQRNEFLVYYQPKLEARSRRMVGMEALIRWKPDAGAGMVPPKVFVPVLEASGLIVEVGTWVLDTACRQHVQWRRRGMGPVRLSVNISAVQFSAGNLPELVRGMLEDTGMEPELLCLELTESIVVHNMEQTIATLKELSGLGVKLSIDDFGTGYSSLSYLKDMPIDELKIDRSFVFNLPGDMASAAIIETILGMSRRLNMTVVAEGVETIEQADFLTSHGCHELQGFLFSWPMAAGEFFGWCRGGNLCEGHQEDSLACNWESHSLERLAGVPGLEHTLAGASDGGTPPGNRGGCADDPLRPGG